MLYASILCAFICAVGWYKNYQIRMSYIRRIKEVERELRDARREEFDTALKKCEFKEQRDDYKFHLDRMIEEHGKRCDERDEAREVAEKFREKYLALKTKED